MSNPLLLRSRTLLAWTPAAFAWLLALALANASCTSPPPAKGGLWLWGRVVDAQGLPVASVPVTIHGGLATRWKIGETTTDADGQFVFAERVSGAGYRMGNPAPDYVGVCAGNTVGSFNPPAYLPWVDVTIEPGATGECTLVLDQTVVHHKLAKLRARQ